jgi:hypothetical protein
MQSLPKQCFYMKNAKKGLLGKFHDEFLAKGTE